LPGIDQHVRRLLRNLMGSSEELELNTQGRIWLPPALREFANLEKRVALVGLGKRFELWKEETWIEQRDAWFKGAADLEEANAGLARLPP
jgi:MraZ protein